MRPGEAVLLQREHLRPDLAAGTAEGAHLGAAGLAASRPALRPAAQQGDPRADRGHPGVLVREHGQWVIVQSHASLPVQDAEIFKLATG